MPTHPSSPFSHDIHTHHQPDSSPPGLMQWACYKKASAYGSRVGWTLARKIHTYTYIQSHIVTTQRWFISIRQIVQMCTPIYYTQSASSPYRFFPLLSRFEYTDHWTCPAMPWASLFSPLKVPLDVWTSGHLICCIGPSDSPPPAASPSVWLYEGCSKSFRPH